MWDNSDLFRDLLSKLLNVFNILETEVKGSVFHAEKVIQLNMM